MVLVVGAMIIVNMFMLVNILYFDFIGKYLVDYVAMCSFLYFPVMTLLVFMLYRIRGRRNIRMLEKYILYFSCTTIFVMISYGFMSGVESTGPYILFSTWCAIAGWFVTSYISTNNSTKSHTMNALLQMRNNKEFEDKRNFIKERLMKKYKTINNGILAQEQLMIDKENEKRVLKTELQYISNYFEFICAGYKSNDLDEKLLIRTIRGMIVQWYDFIKPFIDEERIMPDGTRNEKVYENLQDTAEFFRRK